MNYEFGYHDTAFFNYLGFSNIAYTNPPSGSDLLGLLNFSNYTSNVSHNLPPSTP